MAQKTLNEIRNTFLKYFEKNDHTIVESSNLVPNNDPTLMFANSGMVQFKNVFTGLEKRDYKRATTSQKCVRAGGKHNDLENVGYTPRHHTFFEMLGNFSFGDYFKEKAIHLAWNLITKDFGLDKNRLYFTVFSEDDEAFNLWKKITGFGDDRIIKIPTSDNFWSMGETGPCGPCSEIFYDHGDHLKGGLPGTKDQDGDRYIEIWNLVFIQYNRKKDGSLIKLDKQYVDTGMGLERLCMALQKKESTYDTDLFEDIIKKIEGISNKKYLSGDENIDVAIRVISDHIRALIFTISDGQIPSNNGPGYVIRRILRRAVRYGYTNLDIKTPFIYELVDIVISKYLTIYPDLENQGKYISSLIHEEEKGFLKTLNQGLSLINQIIESNPNDKKISGEDSFKLYDTYGFPIDLTSLIANENDFQVDIEGFNEYMKIQKIFRNHI